MHASWKKKAVICLALVVGTIAVYGAVVNCDFVSLDDPDYVSRNQQVLGGLSWSGWRYAWTSWHCSNWHPLTWLSLELDSSLWGQKPAGYHATNLLLHAVNAALLFLVCCQLTNRMVASACVAAFFALHPLHVESVAWIAERKDVLSTFFLLLTVVAYVRYAAGPSWSRYLLVLVLFAFGLLAKPMLVTLPILLLLLDGWPLARVQWNSGMTASTRFPRLSIRWLLIEKVPLLMLALADGLTTIAAQFGAVKLMDDVTFGTRVANMFHAYLWYLQKTFVPTSLTIFYPHPERDLSWTVVGIGIVVFGAVSAWVVWRRKSSPHLLFGWAWFVISLLPVIGLIQVGSQAYADRYAYIPHIGLFIAIVWELNAWFAATTVGRVLLGLFVPVALIASGWLTYLQIGYWKNNDTLWTHAIELNPNNGFAHAHLADVRLAEGRHEQAIFHIEQGLRLKRSGYVANAYCNWGRSLLALDRPAEAEQKFLVALQVDPNHEASLDELAKLLRSQGRHAEAARVSGRHAAIFAKKAEQQPENAAAHFRLGFLQAQQGNLRQALVHFEKAVQLEPRSAEARNNLALVQMQLGLRKEAKANFLMAIEFNPDLLMAHFGLANLFESEKDFAGARHQYAEVLRIKPDDVKAKQRLDRLPNP